jgi:GntR family transcriptional regulator / MocR family aminotransferase
MMRTTARPVQSTSTLDLGIERNDSVPIQDQIARQIRELVLGGRLKPNARLPSTRGLAEQLGVARATVVEAFEQLLGEGYLETKRGSGTVVAAQLPDVLLSAGKQRIPLSPSAPRQKREPARPFRSGLVDWENFPHDEWGRILGRYWRNPPITLLEHNDAFGWMPLRRAIAAHLFEWRGITCTPEQVIVTGGGPDAFDLIRRSVFADGDKIWFEDPGYVTARRVFTLAGLDIVPVRIDREGLLVSEGRKKADDARGAFVTPARQYPTGVTMPLSRRLELIAWANETKSIIIEDDYDSEYRYVGKPLPAMMSLDRSGCVIYSGTFSKVFSPIIRMGFIVVPDKMIHKFREERLSYGAPPSLLVQPALAQFMEQGQFAVHIRRMRRLYASRREALLNYFSDHAQGAFTVDAPPSGLSIMLRFKKSVDDVEIERKLMKQGIETQALSQYYSTKPEKGLLLSFAGFSETELLQAAKALVAALSRS